MSRLVLLLEEESMRVLFDGLLPRLFPVETIGAELAANEARANG